MILLLRNVALVLLGLVILLVVAGATYQFAESRAEARRSPEAGRLVDIGGHRLKINCTLRPRMSNGCSRSRAE